VKAAGSARWITPELYTSLGNPQPHNLQVGENPSLLTHHHVGWISHALTFASCLPQDRGSYKPNTAATAAFPCKETEQRNL